ncbi:WXG100-like domain-containing protein, partial [Nonomuraea sp. NPDC004297]
MMAGRGDVNGARKPTGTAHVFDGGIATKDIDPVWRTEALPGWVVHHLIPLLTAGQSWPMGSESKLWELRVEYVKLMNLLIGTLDPTAATVQSLNGSLQSPAKPAIFKRLAKLSDDKAGIVAKAQESFSYAKMVDNFARETQYSKLSVNVAFWIAVTAAFIALIAAGFAPLASVLLRSAGTAGSARIALIMQRLALVASRSGPVTASGQVTKLAATATGAGGKFFNAALAAELVEEISEEVFIDAFAQYQQIKMGTRDTWDWKKVKAAAVGAGTGAVIGTKLGGPVSRFTNDLPGVSRLNRIAGDNPGVGNAFLRFPGRALNTGLNNMLSSPAGSIAANYLVYDQFALPGAEGVYGGFLGGAGRTNTISPFNPSVASAITNPLSTLSSAFDAAISAPPGTPTAGDAALAGPRPGAPDGAAAPVPAQQPAADLTGPARRDRAAAVTQPAVPQPASGRVQTAPDITTPDAPPAVRPKAQQDLPAPRQEAEPDAQAPRQDTGPGQGPVSQPAVQAAAPASAQQDAPVEQPAPATAQAPVASEPAGTPEPTGTPTSATAPEPATLQEPATAPEPAGVPEAASVAEPAVPASESAPAPEPAAVPEPVAAAEPVGTSDATAAPQEADAGTTASVTVNATATTQPGDVRPAAVTGPVPQPATGTPAAVSLVTRLIRTARRTRAVPQAT